MPMEQAQQPQQGGGGESQVQELLANLNTGLGMLSEMLAEVNPELGKQAEALKNQYDQLVSALTGQSEQVDAGQMPQMAGTKGVPANPAMR